MSFKKTATSLKDCSIIEPEVFGDSRGFFMETYSQAEFAKIWITTNFVQDNHSKSKKWVLRWLHFQTRKPQAKLVRVTSWRIYDVVVDLRLDSPTFGKWEGFELSAENKKQLFVPSGFAHGFLTLEDNTEFLYKCDDLYDPGYEWGIIYYDETLAIDWSKYLYADAFMQVEVSDKDKKNPTFPEYRHNPIF